MGVFRLNKNLLEQALAIYKDWFCDYALSDGILPENWKITTIGAISSLVTRGIAPKYDDSSDQIVLNQKCIRDHTIDISLSRRHLPKKINEKWISKGDLLINSTGTGTLGRVAQVWFEANNMTVDSHVTIVRPKDPILQSYIAFGAFLMKVKLKLNTQEALDKRNFQGTESKLWNFLCPMKILSVNLMNWSFQ